MTTTVARRRFLQGSLAIAVVGFDRGRESWASGPGSANVVAIPQLDGQLLMNPAVLAAAADDYGHIVHRTPLAVLVPGSMKDIVKLVTFARLHGIQVAAARGVGESHSTAGQAQVAAGVVIDMSALATIHEINGNDALVDAGVRWIDLLEATLPRGKSPPTLTDYIELSVGGTLSVGGVGGQAFRHGLQVDNILELQVVTGSGALVTCSPWQNPLLWNAVRAGLGQFGIIVRARVRLVPVKPRVRVYSATYTDLAALTADQELLIEDGRFDYVEGSASADGSGGWIYALEAASYFNPGSPPNNTAKLAGLRFDPGTSATVDQSYFDFANRLAPTIAFLEQIGVWQLPHPWLNLFLPGPEAPAFMQAVLDATTLDDTGQGPIVFYPFKRALLGAPFARVPDTPHVFIFSLLRTAIPATPEHVTDLIAQNRQIYEEARAIGGKRYPIDSVPMSPADWEAQIHPLFPQFSLAKLLFDPLHVLTPGQKIFT
ncbi:FAD-binding protein [Chondromyces apiculatus]|uniref:Putative cytokinin oxidase n=1 Tax=Chondromyces apiculatus DSM 436 TaxID=1192034 RepID=A0A017T0H9_9BACT|nr:FAD-binding protein [Chondromyces apiculatus]EYF02497.1 putative cytokinin oxidase [Chondromyces apiculatus DSM 436]